MSEQACQCCGSPLSVEARNFVVYKCWSTKFKTGEFQRSQICEEREFKSVMKEVLDAVVCQCEHLSHSKKHQHDARQKCPVEGLIEKARKML